LAQLTQTASIVGKTLRKSSFAHVLILRILLRKVHFQIIPIPRRELANNVAMLWNRANLRMQFLNRRNGKKKEIGVLYRVKATNFERAG